MASTAISRKRRLRRRAAKQRLSRRKNLRITRRSYRKQRGGTIESKYPDAVEVRQYDDSVDSVATVQPVEGWA